MLSLFDHLIGASKQHEGHLKFLFSFLPSFLLTSLIKGGIQVLNR